MTGRCTRWERWLPGSGGMFKVLNWNLHSFRLLEIIQVLDSISWVRCASGNVYSNTGHHGRAGSHTGFLGCGSIWVLVSAKSLNKTKCHGNYTERGSGATPTKKVDELNMVQLTQKMHNILKKVRKKRQKCNDITLCKWSWSPL